MFARAGFALVAAVLTFAQAVPVPGPEEVHPGNIPNPTPKSENNNIELPLLPPTRY